MAASDASIYWNLKLLSQKLLGKGISTSADQESGTEQPVGLQRRLLTAAYAVLLDTGPQEAYADVPDEERCIHNLEATAAELLRMRAAACHGSAARLTRLVDELQRLGAEQLQQQQGHHHQQQTCDDVAAGRTGAHGPDLERVLSLLLCLRGSAATATAPAASAVSAAAGRLAAAPQPSHGPVTGATPGALDGPLPGRRLRLAPPPAALPAPGEAPMHMPPWGGAAKPLALSHSPAGLGHPSHLLELDPHPEDVHAGHTGEAATARKQLQLLPYGSPLRGTPRQLGRAAHSREPPTTHTLPAADGLPAPARTSGVVGPLLAGAPGDAAAAAAAVSGWFPFRDTAGLPVAPAFDAPLNVELGLELLPPNGGDANTPVSGPGGTLPRWVASGDGAGAGAGAEAPATAGPPIHRRFTHVNPLLWQLGGTSSECFRLGEPPLPQPPAPAPSPPQQLQDPQLGEHTLVGAESSVLGVSAAGPGADQQEVAGEEGELAAPFALAALGVGGLTGAGLGGWAGGLLAARSPMARLLPPSLAAQPSEKGTGRDGREAAAAKGAENFDQDNPAQRRAVASKGVGGKPAAAAAASGASATAVSGGKPAVAAAAVCADRSLECEVLAFDVAVMALLGVGAALRMLRAGEVRSPSLRLVSQRRLLVQLCDVGELRRRLGAFVAAHGAAGAGAGAGAGAAGQGAGGQAARGQGDECLAAFAEAVRQLLALYDAQLQDLAAAHRPRPRTGDGPAHSATRASAAPGAAGAGGGCGLLGLLLCLTPLRVHLQRLADVCGCVPDPAFAPSNEDLAAAAAAAGAPKALGGDVAGAVRARAPSLWRAEGFPRGTALLDKLYFALIQSDHVKKPLLRLLFTAACAPYLRRVRAWVYDPGLAPEPGATGGGGGGGPPEAPVFAAPMQRVVLAAGLQMRLLAEAGGELGRIADRVRHMAAAEAEEARLIAAQWGEALAAQPPAHGQLQEGGLQGQPPDHAAAPDMLGAAPHRLPGLLAFGGLADALTSTGGSPARQGSGGAGGPAAPGVPYTDEFHYPLVFRAEALQQLAEASVAAEAARDAELTLLLELQRRRREAAAAAADAAAAAAAAEALAAQEAAREAKAAAAEAARLARTRLLAEQREALGEREARLRDERERRVGEEQQLLAEAVLREHNEAAAALAAELARLRLSYGTAVPATAAAASSGAADGRGGAAAGARVGEDGSGGDGGVVGGDARAAEAAAWLRRCEWREARLALAARRRLMWQGIEAEELDQLRTLVRAAKQSQSQPAQQQPGSPAGPFAPPLRIPRQAEDAGPPLPPVPDNQTNDMEVDSGAAVAAAAVLAAEAAESLAAAHSPRPPQRSGPSLVARLRRRSVLAPPGSPGSPLQTAAAMAAAVAAEFSSRGSGEVSDSNESKGLGAREPEDGRAQYVSAAGGGAAGGLPLPLPLLPPPPPPQQGPHHRAHNMIHAGAKRRLSISGAADRRGGSTLGGTPAAAEGPNTPLGPQDGSAWGLVLGGSGPLDLRTPSFVLGAAPAAGGMAGRPDAGGARPWTPSVAGTSSVFGGSVFGAPARAGEAHHAHPGAGHRGHSGTHRPGSAARGSVGSGTKGLLLHLHTRQARRRWGQPAPQQHKSPSVMAAPGEGPASPGSSRPGSGPGGRGSVGGAWGSGGQESPGAGGRAAALRQYQQLQRQHEAVAHRLASADVATGVATEHDGGGGGGVTHRAQRRRALWKLPTAWQDGPATAAAPAGLPGRSSGGGVVGPSGGLLERVSREVSSAGVHHAMEAPPGRLGGPMGAGPLPGAWDSPAKALLRDLRSAQQPVSHAHGLHANHGAAAAALGASARIPYGQVATEGLGTGEVELSAVGGAAGAAAAAASSDLSCVPVGVAMDTCLAASVLSQYRLTTRATWHVLVHECSLAEFSLMLRRFFLCEAGDVASSMAASLTALCAARPRAAPSSSELRSALHTALAGSSLATGAGGGRGAMGAGGGGGQAAAGGQQVPAAAGPRWDPARVFQVASVPGRAVGAGGYFGSDCLFAWCEVPRPLDAVLTPDCCGGQTPAPGSSSSTLRTPSSTGAGGGGGGSGAPAGRSGWGYPEVLSVVLRVRCAGELLAGCWARLNAATRGLAALELRGGRAAGLAGRGARGGRRAQGGGGGGEGPVVHPLWQQRLKLARQWLQAASRFTSLLLQHMQIELTGRCWAVWARELQGGAPRDLVTLREAHRRYLAMAREVCFLPPAPSSGTQHPDPQAPRPGSGRGSSTGGGGGGGSEHAAASGPPPTAATALNEALAGALQSAHAFAVLLRQALDRLETAAAGGGALAAPPRQLTLEPRVRMASHGAQCGPGDAGQAKGPSAVAAGGGGGVASSYGVDALDLDDHWAQVVASQVALGRALGGLRRAMQRQGPAAAAAGSGAWGELAAVLEAEPAAPYTRAAMGAAGGGVGR